MKQSGFQKFLNKLGIERVDENDPFDFGEFSAEEIDSDYQEELMQSFRDDSSAFYEDLSMEASDILLRDRTGYADTQEEPAQSEPEEQQETVIPDVTAAEDAEKDDLISDILNDWEHNDAPMKGSGSGRNFFKWGSKVRKPVRPVEEEEEAPIDEKRAKAMREAALAAEEIEREMMREESGQPEEEQEAPEYVQPEPEETQEIREEPAAQQEEEEEEKEFVAPASRRSEEVMKPNNANGVVVALGMFDGVHIGHQHLLAVARRDADRLGIPLNVVTLYEHPAGVLSGTKIPYLSTMEERIALLTKYGMDCLNIYHFTNRFAAMHYREFLVLLIRELRMTHMVIGQNAIFGRGGLGNAQVLQEEAAQFGITVHVVPAVTANGKRISSSSIREAAARGDMPYVNTCLTRPYSVIGTVQHGAERGKLLGFPTANIPVPQGMMLPKNGVYVTRVSVDGGQPQAGVTNIGYHPTVDRLETPIIETHILDCSADLYGKQIRVEFMKMLRDEEAFETFAELSGQIAKDRQAAEEYFEAHPIVKEEK